MELRWRNRGWCAVLVVVQVLLVVCTTSGNSVTAAAARHQENVATTEEETETDAGPPPSPPTLPTAFVTGGGGFKTMTAGMGIIRAWSDTELLRAHTTTHFACASGGCWFQIPFLYSQDYYDAAVGKSSRGGDGNGHDRERTVADFVTSWGENYQTAATQAIATEQYKDIYQYTLETVSNYCPLDLVHIITAGMRKLLNEADFPADNWLNYVDVMLSSYLHVPNATTQLFSSPRAGWNQFVFVAGATLAPDTYQFDPSFETTKLIGIPTGVTLLPISYTANAGSTGSWQFTAAINQTLAVRVGKEAPVPLNTALPPLSLSEVGAATSSAGGALGSPTLAQRLIRDALALPKFGLSKLEQAALKPVIDTCLPLGMQNLSSPTEGNVVSTLSAWSPLFRYMDGGYTENTAITHAIASMQKSCGEDDASNPKYDCTTQTVRLMSIHGTKKKIKRLFANCDCGTTDFPWIGTGMNSHIFLEDFPDPDDPGWTVYSNTTYSLLPDKRFLSFVESTFVDRDIEPSTSYAWRGTVTTVENIPYGVQGGWHVDLVLLVVAVPSELLIDPGYGANYTFANIYSDIAQEQYASTLKLFRNLNLSQDWGAGGGSQPVSPEQDEL